MRTPLQFLLNRLTVLKYHFYNFIYKGCKIPFSFCLCFFCVPLFDTDVYSLPSSTTMQTSYFNCDAFLLFMPNMSQSSVLLLQDCKHAARLSRSDFITYAVIDLESFGCFCGLWRSKAKLFMFSKPLRRFPLTNCECLACHYHTLVTLKCH